MAKFTTADFLSSPSSSSSSGSPTTTTSKGKQPARPDVEDGPSRAPVIPHSLSYENIITPAETEPFPDINADMDAIFGGGKTFAHCSRHCEHNTCRRLVHKSPSRLPCHCGLELAELVPVTFARPQPAPVLDEPTAMALQTLGEDVGNIVDNMVEVHILDMHNLLSQLEHYVVARGLEIIELTEQLEKICPDEVRRGIRSITSVFFKNMGDYFTRTLITAGSRTLTTAELRTELNVYVWTMMSDFAATVCTEEAFALEHGKDPRNFLTSCKSGPLRAISSFWRECVDEIVGLVVWRDLLIREYAEMEEAKKGSEEAAE
ncbi:hypothetical protein J1614_010817 [Plenodomus biglobosus]|nr:hypothetical protein J1614_010817 [Plenodomus biglobosus]